MAPEMFTNLDLNGYTYAIDFYQVGVLLFELLVG